MISIGLKYGYIDTTGKMVIKPQFDQVGFFSEGLALAKVGGTMTVSISSFNMSSASGQGMIDVTGSKCGFIDNTGEMIIKPQFNDCKKFSEGLAPVKIGEKWGYIDKNVEIVIKPQFDNAFSFSQGLAPVKIGEKWGYIDKSGKVVINPQFDASYSFSEGLARIEIGEDWRNRKWGYIDMTGKYIWQP